MSYQYVLQLSDLCLKCQTNPVIQDEPGRVSFSRLGRIHSPEEKITLPGSIALNHSCAKNSKLKFCKNKQIWITIKK